MKDRPQNAKIQVCGRVAETSRKWAVGDATHKDSWSNIVQKLSPYKSPQEK